MLAGADISMLEPASETIDKIHVAHVFEAKSIPAYNGAGTYVCKELVEWCKRTRCGSDPLL